MKTLSLRTSKCGTYVDLQLTVESNNFGDQIITVVFETVEGYKKNVWFELNHEGCHRPITNDFLEYMGSTTLLLNGKRV